MHRDDRAMAGIETQERAVHELAVGQRARRVGRSRGIDGIELHLDRAPSPTPGEVETRLDGESMQPGIEPVRIAETWQVAPGTDQGLLDGVARELRVPEDEAGCRVQPREAGSTRAAKAS
jgi:hypothetical protein